MKPKTELIIRIINLIVIIGLCLVIYINGKSLDCNNCELNLRTDKPDFASASASYIQENIKVKIVDLFNSIKEDYCVLIWDRSRGWIVF